MGNKFRLTFRLTLKLTLQFCFPTKKECEDYRDECLKKGIKATDKYGTDYFYPARRINETSISPIN